MATPFHPPWHPYATLSPQGQHPPIVRSCGHFLGLSAPLFRPATARHPRPNQLPPWPLQALLRRRRRLLRRLPNHQFVRSEETLI